MLITLRQVKLMLADINFKRHNDFEKPVFRVFVQFGKPLFFPVNRSAFFFVVLMKCPNIYKATGAKSGITVFHLRKR